MIPDSYAALSNRYNKQARHYVPAGINYAILVPTLRCNLSCSYCQVSRANQDANGYDWTNQNLKAAINFIAEKATPGIKIEFQGGEPTLRLDLLRSIIDELNDKLIQPSFVICSNLQEVGDELLDLINRKNVQISCSLDGPQIIHQQNRTMDDAFTDQFYRNFRFIRKNFGDDKISVVSTVADYSTIPQIIDFYFEEKIPELFLRPVNYQGFARKAFNEEAKDLEAWQQAYKSGIEHIFQRNALGSHKLVEATFAIHLSKFFNPSNNGYVDLRTPNPLCHDYIVIDYDGALYPSDEARMVSRVGLLDLKVGNLEVGLDEDRVRAVNVGSSNECDPTCMNCRFQSYCGVDNIDRVSRYGTIDVATEDTYFCQNHFGIFDFVENKIRSSDPIDQRNLLLHLTGVYQDTTLFQGWLDD